MSQNVCGGCGAQLGNAHSKVCSNYNQEAPLFWGAGGVPAEQFARPEETPAVAFFEDLPEDPARPDDMHPLAETLRMPEDPELCRVALELRDEVRALRSIVDLINFNTKVESQTPPPVPAAPAPPTYLLVYPVPPKVEDGKVVEPLQPPAVVEMEAGAYNVLVGGESIKDALPQRQAEEMVPLSVLLEQMDKWLETAMQRGDNRNQLNAFRMLVTSNTVKGVRVE